MTENVKVEDPSNQEEMQTDKSFKHKSKKLMSRLSLDLKRAKSGKSYKPMTVRLSPISFDPSPRLLLSPNPSCPDALPPQHLRDALSSTAQV